MSIPSEMAIVSLQKLKIPVLTADTKIDCTLKYQDIVSIERYSKTFDTAGGVNLPKICTCIGSDGQRYKQLVCSLIVWSQL